MKVHCEMGCKKEHRGFMCLLRHARVIEEGAAAMVVTSGKKNKFKPLMLQFLHMSKRYEDTTTFLLEAGHLSE